MTCAKTITIDEVLFSRLWKVGLSYTEISKAMNIPPSSVHHHRARLGLPRRKAAPDRVSVGPDEDCDGAAENEALKVPVMPPHPFWTRAHDAAVMRTKGHYRDIAGLAADWGKTHATVLQRWHLLRG